MMEMGEDTDMTEDTPRPAPPKEGSNRGHEVEKHARANIEDTISGRPAKSHSDHVDDGLPDNTQSEEGERLPRNEDDPTGAADAGATNFKRSI